MCEIKELTGLTYPTDTVTKKRILTFNAKKLLFFISAFHLKPKTDCE